MELKYKAALDIKMKAILTEINKIQSDYIKISDEFTKAKKKLQKKLKLSTD